MSNETLADVAERELGEFRRELLATTPDTIDLLAVEERVLELAKAWGRAVVGEAMNRADAEAPEVVINGELWENRRTQENTYDTAFGEVVVERSSSRGPAGYPFKPLRGAA
jgi:hypothetical protein